ncbi:MAG: MFS transporter [Chloroflexi bacterium]|nr:MFS transporter [Chloroflexota bacterium]
MARPSDQLNGQGATGDRSFRSASYYKWLVLATIGLGVLTSTVDGSIVNIALPTLAEEFNTDAGTILWVSVSFLLASIGLMLTLGSLGDSIGRKRVFLAGFVVFGVGLTFAPLSQSLTQLIAARVIQGIGQAMIISNGNALIVAAFPANERGRALGLENAVVGVGLASGPPLGGFLLDALGWQALFYTRIPFVALFFVMSVIFLQPDDRSARKLRLDLPGSITMFTALSAFLLAVNRGPKIGWTDPFVLTLVIIAVVSTVGFLAVEMRARAPVLELSLFKSRLFSMANAASAPQFVTQGAIIILMPFFLLQGRAMSASQAGLVLITLPIVRLVMGPLAGWASDKVQSRLITTFGLVLMTVAYAGLRTVGVETPIALLVVLLLISGAGSSIFGPANNSAIMGAVPPTHLGTASGMIATVRQVSQATGLALAGTLFAIFKAKHETELIAGGAATEFAERQAAALGFQEVLTLMLVFLVAATVVSALRGPDRFHQTTPPARQPVPDGVKPETHTTPR